MPNQTATITIAQGELRGSSSDGIDKYLGIPYAAAPVGDLRFALPVQHPGWDGVRDATVQGATAPQAEYGAITAALLATVVVEGDEYLNLNIWAPTGGTKRPVMFWVHGGSLAHGSNALDGYDGTAFARDGIVLVTINYRVGVEGFSVLDGAPRNFGLADAAAALRWVRDNIAAFGGDPSNVTVFGQSAGATVLWALLAGDERLFARAILQSGPAAASPEKVSGKISKAEAKHLGIAPTRTAFAATPSAKLIEAEKAVTAGTTPITGGVSYSLTLGGDLVPKDPMAAIIGGAAADIPIMIGWTSEEYRLWLVPTGLVNKISAPLFAAVRARFKITGRVLGAYKAGHPGASRGELFGLLATDILIRLPFHKIADARLRSGAAPTYVYEFDWRSPVQDLGAAHAIELGFVFDKLSSPDWIALGGSDAPQQLADEMHAAWVRFATTGDPGWTAWNAGRPVEVFDAPVSRLEPSPRDAELEAWGAVAPGIWLVNERLDP